MKYIAHRINTVRMLMKIPYCYGVEVDLRDCGKRFIIQHDPFSDGENFEDYLKNYRHSTLILNIKSEGVEFAAIELLKKYRIEDYFFLDSSFGMIYRLSSKGEQNIALRYSEFEGLDTILAMKGRIKWVWVDCFTKLNIDRNAFDILKKSGFMLCLTSPDLLDRPGDIPLYRKYITEQNMIFDAICTKFHNIEKWEEATLLK